MGYEHRVVRWRPRAPLIELERIDAADFQVAARYEHPHLAGLHTIDPLSGSPGGLAALSCAAADAVLLLDPDEGRIARTLRLPRDLYGRNYDLAPGMDLRRHYIHDELQTTHVNAAFGDRTGRWVTVSTLIQGAIGVFDLQSGKYEEVTRGFVGCHGARFDDKGNLYFADSTTGHLVTLADDGRIARRFAVASAGSTTCSSSAAASTPSPWRTATRCRSGTWSATRCCSARRFRVGWGRGSRGEEAPLGWVGNSVQALALSPWP